MFSFKNNYYYLYLNKFQWELCTGMYNIILCPTEGPGVYPSYKLPLRITYFHLSQLSSKIAHKGIDPLSIFFNGTNGVYIWKKHEIYDKLGLTETHFHIVVGQI